MAKEINLKELFGVLKQRLWIIIITTILAGIAGYVFGLFFNPTPLYGTGTRIVVGEDATDMSTLKVMIEDPTVLEIVSNQLDRQRSPGALAAEIKADNIDGSKILSISVVDRDPALAAEIANTT
ncbi:MAG TPA: Wzz/FepE/Etk N-terminal domain-containing protein, partial [Bacillales bacterium]|nr:Wzz/FepE/Etk N-terminal domain-containing protein [Bacillales bacterium]